MPSDPFLASQHLLALNVLLDSRDGKEIKLVRRGKRIPWERGTVIEAFLWRTSEAYERGYQISGEEQEANDQQVSKL